MKHNLQITAILLLMFILTQFIGLYVIDHYMGEKGLPYGLGTPEPEKDSEFYSIFTQILIAFVIAIVLIFILMKFKIELLIKIWFFIVVLVALGISLTSFFPQFKYVSLVALAIAIPFSVIKIWGKNMIIHNVTELLVYPGIAAVFVPILNVKTMVIFLVIISVYDIWAVWRSGFMQKMAKYQINKLKVFSGFFIPYISKRTRARLKKMKKTELKLKKIKVNVAILGGGDVIFPIITAGVMLKTLGPLSSLLVILGAVLGLGYLFFVAKKKKFYPAMPFITIGMFLGIGVSYLIYLL